MTEPKESFPRTITVLEQGIQAGLHLGAQVYVSRRGHPLADFAFGSADSEQPLRNDHLMPWLSSGKPITAVAIAQLVERGIFDWDTPVATIIPEFGNNGKEAITIRHLLTHTAGLRQGDRIDEKLSWKETVEAICQMPMEPDWPPGTKAGYHISSTWFVLGEIIQRADGRSFGEYIRQEVFLPIGANHSWIGLPGEEYEQYGERIGIMYGTFKSPPTPRPFWDTKEGCVYARPGSNSRGPARELGLFYEALLGLNRPDPLLTPESLSEMTKRQRVGMFDQTFRHVMDWGLGFIINSSHYGADTVPYGFGAHATNKAFGHSGSQSSTGFADPEYDLVIAWVCNGMPGETRHQQRAKAINSAIYEDLGLGPAPK